MKIKKQKEELLKGKWTWIDLHGDEFETLCCSKCGYTEGRENYNFCPSCGKPMISGKKDKNTEEIKELEAKL